MRDMLFILPLKASVEIYSFIVYDLHWDWKVEIGLYIFNVNLYLYLMDYSILHIYSILKLNYQNNFTSMQETY